MLNGTLNTNNATQMGTGITAWNGDTPPGDNPKLYDIDGIENTASTVSTLHGLGDHAICYIEVGTAGNYYTAAQEGVPATYYAQLKKRATSVTSFRATRSTSSTSTPRRRYRSSRR